MDDKTQAPSSVVGPISLVVGIVGLLTLMFFTGWALHGGGGTSPGQAASATTNHYTPQTRSFTMTIVPYWVHEVTGTYDYLAPEFGKKGLLAGKEVWGFSPSTIVVSSTAIVVPNPSEAEAPGSVSENVGESGHAEPVR